MFKSQEIFHITCQEWDELVKKTYKKPYAFQQQEGCKSRGSFEMTVPCVDTYDHEMNEELPKTLRTEEMGIKFDIWLGTEIKEAMNVNVSPFELSLYWERNFYPDVYTLANDLLKKGLIEKGTYIIKIDW